MNATPTTKGDKRKVARAGIGFHSAVYWDDALAPWIGKIVQVKETGDKALEVSDDVGRMICVAHASHLTGRVS